MTRQLLILLLCLDISIATAQEKVYSEPKHLQQLYLGFGAGPTTTFAPDLEKHGLTLFTHLNISFSKSIFYRGGIYYTPYADNLGKYQNLNYTGTQAPHHELYSYYLSIGKRKQLNQFFIILATAGMSYNRHFSPENIGYKPGYGFSFFGYGDPFEYKIKRKNNPGFILQAELIGSRRLGFGGTSLGTYFHYIPQATTTGLTLTFNIGLLSRN